TMVEELQHEITERRRAEDRLRESEQWLSTTLRSIGDAVIATDAGGLVTLMNPVAENLTGWDEPETAGKPLEDIFNIINDQTGGRAENPVVRVLREGVVVGLADHTVLIAKDGTKRPIADSGAPIRNEEGEIIGAVIVFRDITELKQAEEELRKHHDHLEKLVQDRTGALRESEEKYREVVETSVDGVISVDSQMKVGVWNKGAERIFGYTEEEMIGQSLMKIVPERYKKEKEKGFVEFRKSGSGPVIGKTLELQGVRKDGTEISFELSVSSRKKNETHIATATVRDITERKHIEEQLRHMAKVFMDSTDPIIIEDLSGNVVDMNVEAERAYGWKRKELIGKPIKTVVPAKYHEQADELLARCKAGEALRNVEGWRWDKAGKVSAVLLTLFFLTDEDGKPVAIVSLAKDITERKQAEQSLIESERKSINLIENVPVGIALSTPGAEGSVTEINSTLLKILGYQSKDEFLKLPASVHYYDLKERERFSELRKQGPVKNYETRFKRKDGSVFWGSVTSVTQVTREGITQFLNIFEDITERKRNREQIKILNEQMRIILDASPAMIFYKDKENRFIQVNETLARACGKSKQEMEGKSLWDLYPKEAADQYWQDDKEVIADGKSKLNIIESMETPDGTIWVQTDKIPYQDSKGETIGIIGFALDITERKQAEEKTKQLQQYLHLQIERMPIGLIVWDTEFRMTSWNPAAEKIFGYTAQEALGKHPYGLIVPKEVQSHVNDIWGRLLEGDTTAHSMNDNITKDGRTILCKWSNTPLKEADGTVMGVLSMVQDITQRKRAEDKIKASLKEKEVLLQEIHHRVKNNLQVMSSLLDIQARTAKDKDIIEMLSESRNRINAMALIHTQLYESTSLSEIHIKGFVDALMGQLFQIYSVQDREITPVVRVVDYPLPISVAVPVGLILNELLTNAFKYAFAERKKGEIEISFDASEKGKISLTVSDNGIGLPQGFDINKSETLGLHLVKILVEDQLRGNLAIISIKGTTFKIEFEIENNKNGVN
ncbi:MAG: PAS domain S-box protein, partial [Desulfobacterales bacterium]|nr:PAS domain S-box protein [Desulfobacterales bacterium]